MLVWYMSIMSCRGCTVSISDIIRIYIYLRYHTLSCRCDVASFFVVELQGTEVKYQSPVPDDLHFQRYSPHRLHYSDGLLLRSPTRSAMLQGYEHPISPRPTSHDSPPPGYKTCHTLSTRVPNPVSHAHNQSIP